MKRLPLAGRYPLIVLLGHQLGKRDFVFHRQHEQGIEYRAGETGSLAAPRVGLQFTHQGVELRATPKQLELLPKVRKSCIDYLEIGIVFDHAQFSITLGKRDHK